MLASFTLVALLVASALPALADQGHLPWDGAESWLPESRGLLGAGSQDSAAESCVFRGLAQVSESCSGQGGGPRDSLIRLLQSCIKTGGSGKQKRPLRVLAGASAYGIMSQRLAQQYANITAIPIRWDLPLTGDVLNLTISTIANAANYIATHEVWTMSSLWTSVGIGKGAFQNITNLALTDRRLNWEGILPFLRTASLTYQSEVIALPASTITNHLYYRKDIFAKYNISVPRTWDELANFTARYNGTDGMFSFCGLWANCTLMHVTLLRSMLASVVQTQGMSQGWLFNPDTMELMWNNTAMYESLRMLKVLFDFSPPDFSFERGCPFHSYRFSAGQCLMTTAYASHFKYVSHRTRAGILRRIQGNLGVASWPGSARVLDVPTNTLVPCTEQRCPHAARYTNPDGSSTLINQSPAWDALIYSINANADPDMRFFAYQIVSYLVTHPVQTNLVFNQDSEIVPTRTNHLDLRAWLNANYNENDTREWLREFTAVSTHPNINLQCRQPGAINLMRIFRNVPGFLASNMSVREVAEMMYMEGNEVIRESYPNDPTRLKLKADYYGSLNRPLPRPPAPPPFTAPSLPNSAPVAPTTGGDKKASVIVSAVLPTVLVLALALALFVFRKRILARWRAKKGSRNHPSAIAPATTLCVTDIAGSTDLWEEIDARVMDTAVKLHNACIRGLAAKHDGYESVWEGDSFIIAFHHPSAAVAFCTAVQQQLLHLPWPAELLQSSHASEVWCREAEIARKRNSDTGQRKLKKTNTLPRLIDLLTSPQQSPIATTNPLFMPETPTTTSPLRQNASVGIAYESGPFVALVDTPTSGVQGSGIPAHMGLATSPLKQHGSTGDMLATAPVIGSPLAGAREAPIPNMSVSDDLRRAWVLCEAGTPGSVLAFRGLRVRLGFHATLETLTTVTFNSVMQRYHYTGPIRVISNAVASAGHGGYTLMNTSTAALLDLDGSGVLKDLPDDCGVYYMGKHVLQGSSEPLDLLLVLPESLRCRLALQQADLRSEAIKVPGILTAPVPSPAASDSTALAFVQFSGLSTLIAWDAEETSKAIRQASACISDVLASCQGTLSEDGLQLSVLQRNPSRMPAYPDAVQPGRIVCAISGQPDDDSFHPAVVFALAVREQLLTQMWSDRLLEHQLCQPMGELQEMTSIQFDESQDGTSDAERANRAVSASQQQLQTNGSDTLMTSQDLHVDAMHGDDPFLATEDEVVAPAAKPVLSYKRTVTASYTVRTSMPSMSGAGRPPSMLAARPPSMSGAVRLPSISGAARLPSMSGTARQPSMSGAVRHLSMSDAMRQPSMSGAARQPSMSGAVRQPSMSVAVRHPSVLHAADLHGGVQASPFSMSLRQKSLLQQASRASAHATSSSHRSSAASSAAGAQPHSSSNSKGLNRFTPLSFTPTIQAIRDRIRTVSSNGSGSSAVDSLLRVAGINRNRTAGMSQFDKQAAKSHEFLTIEPSCLRGPRVRIVVTSAQQATWTVAIRSSGRVVYSGLPVKRSAKRLQRATPGEIIVDASLLAVQDIATTAHAPSPPATVLDSAKKRRSETGCDLPVNRFPDCPVQLTGTVTLSFIQRRVTSPTTSPNRG